MDKIQNSRYADTNSGADTVSGESVLDNVTGTFKDAFGLVSPKQKLDDYGSSASGGLRYTVGTGNHLVNSKCKACGAPLRGVSGTSVRCEYCGTRQQL